jgi:hypothetical protein
MLPARCACVVKMIQRSAWPLVSKVLPTDPPSLYPPGARHLMHLCKRRVAGGRSDIDSAMPSSGDGEGGTSQGQTRALSGAAAAAAGRVGGEGGEYDLIVVGAGIVGLSTAREMMLRFRGLKVAVLDKESAVGFHQTGHNSGVVHAGIYYPVGSLKAKLCVEGLELSYKYFNEKKIPYKVCFMGNAGKLASMHSLTH